MSFPEAWGALRRGDLDQAERLFDSLTNRDFPAASAGLIRVYIERDDLETANDLAIRLLDFNSTPRALALLGEVVGRRGKRKKAESLLLSAVAADPGNGYYHVLLGEQRIRRGRWDEGANDFLSGLSAKKDRTMAFHHVQTVMTDLTSARANGKIAEADAVRFVNLVDNRLPGKTREMTTFFASIRRALVSNAAMEMPTSRSSVDTAVEVAVSQPASSSPARPRPPQREREQPRTQTRTKSQPQTRSQARKQARDAESAARNVRHAASIVSLMERDRALNEELLGELEFVSAPEWPSSLEELDHLPRMCPELLGFDDAEQRTSHLRLNEGDMESAILIRRALDVLHARASASSARPPVPSLRGVAQLEVMCWDGLLNQVQDVPKVYVQQKGDISTPLLAIGGFLGACVTGDDRFVWKYESDPVMSYIQTPHGAFRPFKLAGQWLASDDQDKVDLVGAVTFFLANKDGVTSAFLDTTLGLSDLALKIRLAELWMSYRAHKIEIAQVDVTESIEVLYDVESIIIFTVGKQFAPEVARGPRDSALVGDRVPVAYLRKTGEFLVLASKKHAARMLSALFTGIRPNDVAHIVELVSSVCRPGMKVVDTGPEDERPRFVRFENGWDGVMFGLKSRSHTERLRVIHNSEASTWRVEVV